MPALMLSEEETTSVADQDTSNSKTLSAVQVSEQAVPATASVNPIDLEETKQTDLVVDGEYAPTGVIVSKENGVTYVALASMATLLDPTAQVSWDAGSGTVTVKSSQLNLTATVGQTYLQANGRYLYLPSTVQMIQGRVTVPLSIVTKAFDATVGWDATTGVTTITRGSGGIASGDAFYPQESLFWLSRAIYAESGNQTLKGQIAVGNVIMNRVASSIFPDTIQGVLAQKNQFTTYRSGALANRTPNASSVVAAKLVLDGAVVSEVKDALYFDSTSNSWASRNKTCIAVIGNHKFYR
jgi:N-acetylmuramoyl-L-alanine amidase